MKRRLLPLLLLALLLAAAPVLAYTYSASIIVTESSSNNYTMLPIIASIDNAYLADNGYISSSGLDTRVLEISVEKPHMLTDDKTLFCSDISADESSTFNYTLGNDPLTSFSIITGYDGYITIADAANLELGNNFEIEQKGYIDTSSTFSGTVDSGSATTLIDDALTQDDDYWNGAYLKIVTTTDGLAPQGETKIVTDFVAASDELQFDALTVTVEAGDTYSLTLDKNLVHKKLAIKTYVSADGTIKSSIMEPVSNGTWVSPTSASGTDWSTPSNVYDENTGTYSQYTVGNYSWSTNITMVRGTVICDGVRYYADRENSDIQFFNLDVYYDDDWHVVASSSSLIVGSWQTVTIGSFESVTQARMRFWNNDVGTDYWVRLHEFDFNEADETEGLSVTATGISSGVHTVKTTADGTNFKIYVDDVEKDSIALSGNSVEDTSNSWTIMQNNSVAYMEYMTIDVSGVEKLYYQPNTMIISTALPDRTVDSGTADSGSTTTLIDDALTQADDYWNNMTLEIVTTTDGEAPQGETAIITDFVAGEDKLVFAAFTATVGTGDTYELRSDGTITFGSNPAGISVAVGGLESTGAVVGVPAEELTPPQYVSETPAESLFTESTGEGIPLLYPVFKMVSDQTGWPIQIFWITGALSISMLFGAIALMKLHSMMIAAIISGAILIAPCSMGLVPWWTLFVYAAMAATFIVYQRVSEA